jgi:hypothetical protein
VAQRYPVAGNDNTKHSRVMENFMNTEAHRMTRQDLETKIVQRSLEDDGFRNELIADPAGAFGKYLQVPADRLPQIVLHEETAGTWHIVLPAKTASALSDADLERVAGGGTPTVSVVVVASAAAGGAAAGGVTPTLAATAVLIGGGVASAGAVISGVISAAETGW